MSLNGRLTRLERTIGAGGNADCTCRAVICVIERDDGQLVHDGTDRPYVEGEALNLNCTARQHRERVLIVFGGCDEPQIQKDEPYA